MIKNFLSFVKKCQKTAGRWGDFLTHTVVDLA